MTAPSRRARAASGASRVATAHATSAGVTSAAERRLGGPFGEHGVDGHAARLGRLPRERPQPRGVGGPGRDQVRGDPAGPVGGRELAHEVGQRRVRDACRAGVRGGFDAVVPAEGDDPGARLQVPVDRPHEPQQPAALQRHRPTQRVRLDGGERPRGGQPCGLHDHPHRPVADRRRDGRHGVVRPDVGGAPLHRARAARRAGATTSRAAARRAASRVASRTAAGRVASRAAGRVASRAAAGRVASRTAAGRVASRTAAGRVASRTSRCIAGGVTSRRAASVGPLPGRAAGDTDDSQPLGQQPRRDRAAQRARRADDDGELAAAHRCPPRPRWPDQRA